MKKIKLLFQGDSITDAGRDRSDIHNLGEGYATIAAKLIAEKYPNVEFEFINLGIGAERTGQLFDRWYSDCVALSPDIVSIFIGINDVWHRRALPPIFTTEEQIEVNYRSILEQTKERLPETLIAMVQPYNEGPDQADMRDEVVRMNTIIGGLAEKYADSFIKLDDEMHAHKDYGEYHHFTRDGVHPNEVGAKFIADLYVDAVSPLIEKIIAK